MGWMVTSKPHDLSSWLSKKLTWTGERGTNRVLDTAIVGMKTAYAAVETIKPDGEREVWCAIYLLKFYPNDKEGYTFGYKDLTEHMGTGETSCPARILDLLTPTDHEGANRFRAECRERIARRQANKLKVGDYIRFEKPIGYGGAGEFTTFMYCKQGRQTFFRGLNEENGSFSVPLGIKKWREREFEKLTPEQVEELKAGANSLRLG